MLALYNSEEQLLSQTAEALADSMAIRTLADTDKSDTPESWRRLSASGVLGLRVPDGDGQPAGTGVDVMIVADALGSFLVSAPFLESAILPAELLRVAGADPALEEIASGAARYGLLLGPDLAGLATIGELGVSIGWGLRHADYALALDDSGRGLVRLSLDGGCEDLGSADLTRALSRPAASLPYQPVGQLDSGAYDEWLSPPPPYPLVLTPGARRRS